jgi:hypothetical protein
VDLQPIHWLAFGADSLKTLGISPDAFCQAVLQVFPLFFPFSFLFFGCRLPPQCQAVIPIKLTVTSSHSPCHMTTLTATSSHSLPHHHTHCHIITLTATSSPSLSHHHTVYHMITSPDPLLLFQPILQVAALRYFGKHVLTYESASLRTFHLGRTECIRSASSAMTSFARAFLKWSQAHELQRGGGGGGGGGDGVTKDETAEVGRLLREAGKTHSRLSKQASVMQGVDRPTFSKSACRDFYRVNLPWIFH